MTSRCALFFNEMPMSAPYIFNRMSSVQGCELIRFDIETFALEGIRGRGRRFVEGAVPGDRVKAYIYDTKSNHAEAKFDTLLEPSDLSTKPRCPYADECGGCKWQHVAHEVQIGAKRQMMADAFEHHTDFEHVTVHR